MKLSKIILSLALATTIGVTAVAPANAYPTASGAAGEASAQVRTSNGVKVMIVGGTVSDKLAGKSLKVTAVLKGVTITLGTVKVDENGNFVIKSSKTTKPGVYKVTVAGTGVNKNVKTVITITVK